VLKGESQGKSLIDAMRDGSDDGMLHFDGEIQKLIREGVVDIETGLAFATNAGNLRLELADLMDGQENIADSLPTPPPLPDTSTAEAEMEIER
jgi:twitching motility protein PilT